MKNKYAKSLQLYASQLDSLLSNYECTFTRLTLELLETGNDSNTRLICEELSKLAKSNDTDICKNAAKLKDCLIDYYGYNKVKEICNNEEHIEAEQKSIEQILQELDMLVGLDKVKEKVNDLIAFQCVRKKRELVGLYSDHNTLHMAFTGNPGTGKTTVARIIGKIYKELGLLSSGHFLEVSRTDLIAGYQGQTALKVKDVISRARGGVLFIDEAYSITENEHSDSYGRECLTELTKALEDYRDDLVVIVAGYTEPMKIFFESNPGLRSRFNWFIEFDDYNSDELIKIFESICETNNYKLSEKARIEAIRLITEAVENKDDLFSNGRYIRNFFENITMNHSRRVYGIDEPSKQDLMVIEAEDVNG